MMAIVMTRLCVKSTLSTLSPVNSPQSSIYPFVRLRHQRPCHLPIPLPHFLVIIVLIPALRADTSGIVRLLVLLTRTVHSLCITLWILRFIIIPHWLSSTPPRFIRQILGSCLLLRRTSWYHLSIVISRLEIGMRIHPTRTPSRPDRYDTSLMVIPCVTMSLMMRAFTWRVRPIIVCWR